MAAGKRVWSECRRGSEVRVCVRGEKEEVSSPYTSSWDERTIQDDIIMTSSTVGMRVYRPVAAHFSLSVS